MPLVLFIVLVVLVETAAPGLLGHILGALAPLIASREFFLGLLGSSLGAGFWMSLGQTQLARKQRDAAVEKAEAQYQKDKGWF